MKNLSIKIKLIFLLCFSSLALIGTGLVSTYGFQKTLTSLNLINNVRLPSIVGLDMINDGLMTVKYANLKALAFQKNLDAQTNFTAILTSKKEGWEAINKGLAIYVPLIHDSKETEALNAFLPALNTWQQSNKALSSAIEALALNDDPEKQKQLAINFQEQLKKTQALPDVKVMLKNLIELNARHADKDNKLANYSAQQAQWLILIASILAVTLLLFLGIGLIHSIIKPLKFSIDVAQRIAHGDLSSIIQVDNQAETGELLLAMQTMQNALKNVVADIETSVNAAVNGDFSKQIDLNKHQGYAKNLGSALNDLAETTNTGLKDVTRVADALAQGDLSQRITIDYQGVFGQMKNSINHTVDSLESTVEDIQHFVDTAANHGDFSVKINTQNKTGYNRDLSELLNQLSDVTENGLNDALRIAEALSKGDLTQTITEDYPGIFGQVKLGMNFTVDKLKTLLTNVKRSSENLNIASKEIAMGNNDLSNRTEQQAASLQETAASMEQLTTAVQANSVNANNANTHAIAASDVAGKGYHVVQEVIATMNEISDASRQIADIIAVIDGISFQTNILALNAAVEAARAGEQGKGFAVVASEVRILAHQAAKAASEIKELIGDSETKVANGSKLVIQAGRTMKDIVGSIDEVTAIIANISNASDEQSTGIEQVNNAINQMDDVTQQNAALVEQVAAAAESMAEQSENLSLSLEVFKLSDSPIHATSKPIIKLKLPTKIETYKGKQNTSASLALVTSSSNSDDTDWDEF